jgi:ribosomal protein S13
LAEQMFKVSPIKATADEQMNIAEKLIKKTWSIVNRCKRLMNMDIDNLKRIRRIIYHGELFTPDIPVRNAKKDKKLMEKCLSCLTETL